MGSLAAAGRHPAEICPPELARKIAGSILYFMLLGSILEQVIHTWYHFTCALLLDVFCQKTCLLRCSFP